jgi:protein-S-isoprenylcysteine O-methyltransferase Ste14
MYIALIVLVQVQVTTMLQRTSPDLLAERKRIREGTKPWDKVIAPLIALVLPILMWLTAGLDHQNAPLVQAVGFVIAAASAALSASAMKANRFFSATVRIQAERGHSVISSGPYAVVRHPGCVGMLGFTLATPLALGSTLCLIPAGICAGLMVIRTVLEDRMLRDELEGYADYALRVRWRLAPGLW